MQVVAEAEANTMAPSGLPLERYADIDIDREIDIDIDICIDIHIDRFGLTPVAN